MALGQDILNGVAVLGVSKAPLRDQVREQLTARIFGGTYQPGDRLVETRIAGEFGVSQAVVREALRQLEGLNLVEHAPFKGSRVKNPNPQEVLAVFPVREALEALAIRLAGPRLSEAAPAMQHRLEAMREAACAGDAHAVIVNDAGFHGEIVAVAANAPLRHAFAAVGVDAHTYVTIARLHLELGDVAESHADMLDAVRSGSVEDATRALTEHLESFAQQALDAD